DGEEEHPYTFAKLDESVYEFILAEEEEEKREERRSFILNRPPAPAPRPMCSPVREENTPYIVQVFQQKASQVPSDNNRTYCDARKPGGSGKSHSSCFLTSVVYFPLHSLSSLRIKILVKKRVISVDEALDRFKQWQNEKQRLQSTQQEKVHHLRDTTTGNRLEKEN
ncbi:B-cell scaffold protein with ankyrin repeats, partial [Tyto alba]